RPARLPSPAGTAPAGPPPRAPPAPGRRNSSAPPGNHARRQPAQPAQTPPSPYHNHQQRTRTDQPGQSRDASIDGTQNLTDRRGTDPAADPASSHPESAGHLARP